MINQTHALIGSAAKVLDASRKLAKQSEKVAILLDGLPGCGKSHLLDVLALELTGSKFSIETSERISAFLTLTLAQPKLCTNGVKPMNKEEFETCYTPEPNSWLLVVDAISQRFWIRNDKP